MIHKFKAWDGNTMYTQEDCYFTFGANDYWSCYLTEVNGSHFCCESTTEDIVLLKNVGLKYKNGEDIFEGDLVNGVCYNGSFAIGKVVYWNGMFILEPVGKFVEGVSDIYDKLNFLEKIGNVYENPELVK